MNRFALCRESDQGAELCELCGVGYGKLLPLLDAGAGGGKRDRGEAGVGQRGWVQDQRRQLARFFSI